MFSVYYLQNDKYFLTREIEKPYNKWVLKYPIITRRKYMGDYDSLKTKLHWNHGIENIRSDEDITESNIMSFVDEYNYNVNLDEYEKILEQICEECGKYGHHKEICEEEENIMGRSVFRFVDLNEEEKEEEEEEEEEEYVSFRKF